ncbi:MAG: hypothetical protein Q7R96_01105 [Nanoarchaeota archaeon]|nr:hypothetical protein [Nanoarchaeota archaeon]
MDKQQAIKTIKIFSIIYLVLGCIDLIAGIFFFTFLNENIILALQSVDTTITPTIIFNAAISLLAISILLLISAYLLKHHTKQGRTFALITSALLLFSFPLGTVLGAFSIYFLGFHKDVKKILKK